MKNRFNAYTKDIQRQWKSIQMREKTFFLSVISDNNVFCWCEHCGAPQMFYLHQGKSLSRLCFGFTCKQGYVKMCEFMQKFLPTYLLWLATKQKLFFFQKILIGLD